jgi:hypothetical protein
MTHDDIRNGPTPSLQPSTGGSEYGQYSDIAAVAHPSSTLRIRFRPSKRSSNGGR